MRPRCPASCTASYALFRIFKKTCCSCCASPSAGARFSSKFSEDLDAVARKIVAAKLDGLPQHGVHVHEFALHRPLSRETEQILHNVLWCAASRAE